MNDLFKAFEEATSDLNILTIVLVIHIGIFIGMHLHEKGYR